MPVDATEKLTSDIDTDRESTAIKPAVVCKTEWHSLTAKSLSVAGFACLGVFGRVTLTSLSDLHPNLVQLGSDFLLPNLLGCFLMGMMVELSSELRRHPTLLVGIMSGFCGSCTTFATWKVQTVKGLAEARWVSSVVRIFITISISEAGFTIGRHLGRAANSIRHRFTRRNRSRWIHMPFRTRRARNSGSHDGAILDSNTPVTTEQAELFTELTGGQDIGVDQGSSREKAETLRSESSQRTHLRTILVTLAMFCAIYGAAWIATFLDRSRTRQLWWVAVAFGPLGALVRFWLSLANARYPTFPLFTFIANVAASVINICLYIGAAHVHRDGGPDGSGLANYRFWVLSGVSTGAMGSLSTVSTWINELATLSKKNLWFAYRYGLATFFASELLCWLVIGIWFATGHHF